MDFTFSCCCCSCSCSYSAVFHMEMLSGSCHACYLVVVVVGSFVYLYRDGESKVVLFTHLALLVARSLGGMAVEEWRLISPSCRAVAWLLFIFSCLAASSKKRFYHVCLLSGPSPHRQQWMAARSPRWGVRTRLHKKKM